MLGKLFHSFGAALENALTPHFVVVAVSMVITGGAKRRLAGGPPIPAPKGNKVSVPKGTGKLCHDCSCTQQETRFCSQYTF